MSTRLGMADGRCLDWTSNRLFNNAVISKAGIQETDNYSYRMFLQRTDPSDIYSEPTCSLTKYEEDTKDFDIYSITNVITSENNNRR